MFQFILGVGLAAFVLGGLSERPLAVQDPLVDLAEAVTLGLIFGSIAGYYGGVTDRLLNVVVMNAFMSFPGILLAIAFVAFLGPGVFNLIFAPNGSE